MCEVEICCWTRKSASPHFKLSGTLFATHPLMSRITAIPHLCEISACKVRAVHAPGTYDTCIPPFRISGCPIMVTRVDRNGGFTWFVCPWGCQSGSLPQSTERGQFRRTCRVLCGARRQLWMGIWILSLVSRMAEACPSQ